MSTSDATSPVNRVNFHPDAELYINNFYQTMQNNNLTLNTIDTTIINDTYKLDQTIKLLPFVKNTFPFLQI